MAQHVLVNQKNRSCIEVILKDGTWHHFTPSVLGMLLAGHRVQRFKRSDGWAIVGIDPIRADQDQKLYMYFNGRDRRYSCQ